MSATSVASAGRSTKCSGQSRKSSRPPPPHRGVENGRAKLRDVDVILIRAMYNYGFSQRILCVMFGVRRYTISMIVRNKIWKHLEDWA